MSVIWVEGKAYRRTDYDSEADLETSIIEVQHRLFGSESLLLGRKEQDWDQRVSPEHPGRLPPRLVRFQASPLRGRE